MPANDDNRFSFKVNGVELHSDKPRLTARAILQLAQDKGAIPRAHDKYTLKGDKGEYQLDDEIDLREDKLLIAIPSGPTPVAVHQ